MKRLPSAALLALLAVMAANVPAIAQTAPPTPAPSPSASPAAKHKLFVTGPQFLAAGVSATSYAQSEFRPGGTSAVPDFEAWQTGETLLLGRFHVISYTDYRSFAYEHLASDPVATIGGGGFAHVAPFLVHDDEMESGGGIRIAPQLFFGLELLTRRENSGYPPLHGLGYTLMLAPNPRLGVSPYGWISYTPTIVGNYALTPAVSTSLSYRGMRYRVGAVVNEPGTRIFFDLGFAGEDLHDRTNAPATVRELMLYAGIGVRFR